VKFGSFLKAKRRSLYDEGDDDDDDEDDKDYEQPVSWLDIRVSRPLCLSVCLLLYVSTVECAWNKSLMPCVLIVVSCITYDFVTFS